MCFRIDSPIKYATKPIKVYKRFMKVDGKLLSPYQICDYEFNKEVKSAIRTAVVRSAVVAEYFIKTSPAEFASPIYKYASSVKLYDEKWDDERSIHVDVRVKVSEYPAVDVFAENCIGEGLHSYSSIEAALHASYPEEWIVECKIPAHSWYYVNKDGEVVSDRLILIKEVCRSVLQYNSIHKGL